MDLSGLQLDEAMEMVTSPFEVTTKRPFGEEIQVPADRIQTTENNPRPGSSKRPATDAGEAPAAKRQEAGGSSSKGEQALRHSSKFMKYGTETVPPVIANLFAQAASKNYVLKNAPELQKEFCTLCSTALSRSTWAKYGSAYSKWTEFLKDTHREMHWPMDDAEKIAFVCWNSKRGKISPKTIQKTWTVYSVSTTKTCL